MFCFRGGERQFNVVAAAPRIVVVAPPDRHDGGAHGHAAEGDEKAEQQQSERRRRRTIGEDQVAQPIRIERDQPAEQQCGRGRADGEIDGKKSQQRLPEYAYRSSAGIGLRVPLTWS